MREVFRILKPGGEFVFADPMATPTAPAEVLQPMLDRANLVSFGTVEGYLEDAKAAGFKDRVYEDRTEDFLTNYRTIVAETRARHDELKQEISEAFLKKIGSGMQYWVDGGEPGTWSGAASALEAGVGGNLTLRQAQGVGSVWRLILRSPRVRASRRMPHFF